MSYADKLAAVLSAFKDMLPDLQRFVKEIGEADGWVLTSLHRGTKYEIDALHAMALKLEETINRGRRKDWTVGPRAKSHLKPREEESA